QGTLAPQRYSAMDPLASLSASEKVALLERVEAFGRAADPAVCLVMASVGMEDDVVMVARSDGYLAADSRPLVRLSVTVIVEKDGRREMGNSGGGGRFGLAYFTDDMIQDYVQKAVQAGLTALEAQPAPA